MKTREEVEQLKRSWEKDAIWDLEDTEGFEEYRDELKAHSDDKKREWRERHEKYLSDRRNAWYVLKLNEEFSIDKDTTIRRVPGGWIYKEREWVREPSIDRDDGECQFTSTFIPYNSEFMD